MLKLLPLLLLINTAYAYTVSDADIQRAIAANSQKTAEAHEKLSALQAKANDYLKQQKEKDEAEQRQEQIRLAELAKKPNVRIGMSKSQVINQSSWGEPKYINRTITKRGTREQWVYSEYMYLYVDNGRLTVIQD